MSEIDEAFSLLWKHRSEAVPDWAHAGDEELMRFFYRAGADEQAALVAELVEALQAALAEMRCLGRDLQEIHDGKRTFPTALLCPEIVEQVENAIQLAQFKKESGE